jgi:predicted ATPase
VAADGGDVAVTAPARSRLVVISGCSGGGKSSLLADLANRGHQVIGEPGRRAVQLKLAAGLVLPWTDGDAFARRLLAAAGRGPAGSGSRRRLGVLRPRLVDAAVALAHAIGEPVPGRRAGAAGLPPAGLPGTAVAST